MNDDLSEDTRVLITRALREEPLLPPENVARIQRNVLLVSAGAAVGTGVGKAVAAGGKAVFPTLVTSALKGIALGVLVSSGIHFGGRVLERSPPSRSPTAERGSRPEPPTAASQNGAAAPVASPRLLNPAPPTEAAHDDRTTAGALRRSASPASSALPGAAQPVAPNLREELAALDRIHAALKAGDAAGALQQLDQSAAALGRGSLRQERLAAEVLAACATGDRARARRAARLFLAENSGTPAAMRVRASCAGEQNGGPP